ncbi:hypothetical protein CHGG_04022 [Chaetomium globosum CBS 148.51]|uniref:Alpha/beta hydrolase fold-3 domain-containing protein n=1 Tax=Chaetomium globosum (strain ATCC 6205 / CBS 148.51 / DSM 1962 / NBRC 6347 / NRRL 1970) TaxID=306901 RepID=Q2H2H4_CHAGB|nr:uncharacterized protein CHGG_04022 [Chaetomium globosum CBS 148.51]EAQ87403.1 hypothetical protein CHGG_04022 [Chaetomium globosum CBS 148.51]
MPNYEPTPRRFSTLYVPHLGSRKNSIDGTTHPSFNQNPTPHDYPPVDLAGALQQLQHVEPQSERERGRMRQSGGDNAKRTSWRDDAVAVAPSARRESSTSTRERIEEWEARSRSQSKSRSKSRSRDMGSKHRISVVPQIPDLALAFGAFKKQEATLGDGVQVTEQPRMESNIAKDEPPGEREVNKTLLDGRPQTPVSQTPERPPTPDMAPKPCSSITASNVDDSKNLQYQRSAARDPLEHDQIVISTRGPATPPPKTGSNTALIMDMPLTPQETPERGGSDARWGGPGGSYPAEGENLGDNIEYAAVFQPVGSRTPPSVENETVTQLQAHYHLPSDLLSDELLQQKEQRDHHETASPGPSREPNKPHCQSVLGAETEPLYHNVWRINRYQPEFPAPDRPGNYVDIQTLSQANFAGNPLQQLPQGQLPGEPRNYRAAAVDTYPYSRPTASSSRDWAVDIPPSPSVAYFEGQRVRRPRSRSRARNGATTEHYLSRHEIRRHEWDAPSVMERAFRAASVSMIQGLNVPVEVYRGLRDMYYPAPSRPDIVKAYPIRQRLPIRIFFPSHHDLTSPALLPTLLTIHGGAFTVGTPADDDPWNRTFADSYTILVIALNYAKAPWAAFPAPLFDVEALYHAILNDESLPIDRMRVALAGFDAGANLALALSQLPSVHSGTDPQPTPLPTQPQPHPHPRTATLQPPTHRRHLHHGHPRFHHPAPPKTPHPPLQTHPARPARLGPGARLDGARAAPLGRVELHPVRARRGVGLGVAGVRGARRSAAARVRGGCRAGLSGDGELGGGVSVGEGAGKWGGGGGGAGGGGKGGKGRGGGLEGVFG